MKALRRGGGSRLRPNLTPASRRIQESGSRDARNWCGFGVDGARPYRPTLDALGSRTRYPSLTCGRRNSPGVKRCPARHENDLLSWKTGDTQVIIDLVQDAKIYSRLRNGIALVCWVTPATVLVSLSVWFGLAADIVPVGEPFGSVSEYLSALVQVALVFSIATIAGILFLAWCTTLLMPRALRNKPKALKVLEWGAGTAFPLVVVWATCRALSWLMDPQIEITDRPSTRFLERMAEVSGPWSLAVAISVVWLACAMILLVMHVARTRFEG